MLIGFNGDVTCNYFLQVKLCRVIGQWVSFSLTCVCAKVPPEGAVAGESLPALRAAVAPAAGVVRDVLRERPLAVKPLPAQRAELGAFRT